jgi:hypothetical protein
MKKSDRTPKTNNSAGAATSSNFIKYIIEEDLKTGKNDGKVRTRFPPEPNGYLHIGHAKSICLNFGLAAEYDGLCNLRYDDTDPSKESIEYVASIKEDVRWLGFDWQDREYYASNYFEQLFEYAVRLIKKSGNTAEHSPNPAKTVPTGSAQLKKIWICSNVCGPANSRMGRMCCGPKSIWHPPI